MRRLNVIKSLLICFLKTLNWETNWRLPQRYYTIIFKVNMTLYDDTDMVITALIHVFSVASNTCMFLNINKNFNLPMFHVVQKYNI